MRSYIYDLIKKYFAKMACIIWHQALLYFNLI